MSGSNNGTELGPVYGRYLRELGNEVHFYIGANDKLFIKPRLLHRTILRFAPALAWKLSNERLLSLAKKLQPDVVIVFKGMDIYPATLHQIKDMGIKTVNYNPDHPTQFFKRGSGNKNVSDAIPEYDLYATYSEAIEQELNTLYPDVQTVVIPFGHDVETLPQKEVVDTPDILRACFVGFADGERAAKLRMVAEQSVPLDVYGPNWTRFLGTASEIAVHEAVHGKELQGILRSYRLQINLFRPHNSGSHNMRSMEVPASGGIMLAPRSAEHDRMFEEGVEAFFFDDDEELIDKAKKILALPRGAASSIRAAARQRCVSGGFSYRDRAAAFQKAIQEIM